MAGNFENETKNRKENSNSRTVSYRSAKIDNTEIGSTMSGNFENETKRGKENRNSRTLSHRSTTRDKSENSNAPRKTFKTTIEEKSENKGSSTERLEREKASSSSDHELVTKESTKNANRKLKDLLWNINACGIPVFLLVLINLTLQYTSIVASSFWLSDWSEDVPTGVHLATGAQNLTTARKLTIYRLAVYGAIGSGQVVFLFLGSILLIYWSGDVDIHTEMLCRIIRAPISFFDATPQGRIVDRFSNDVYLIDTVLPRDLHDCLWTLFSIISTIFVVSYVFPIFLLFPIIVPFVVIYYITLLSVYMKTSHQLKRVESDSRAPIYSHLVECFNGASTIRAYNLQGNFIKEYERKVDDNQAAYYSNIVSSRWLALRFTFVGSLIVFFTAFFVVNRPGETSSGLVGLSISYAIQTTQIMNWFVRQMCSLQSNIVAVENVEEYSNIEQEAPLHTNAKLSKKWPSDGAIKYANYWTKYGEGLVVEGIDLDIDSGEKIGVVGRTGGGKSSLVLALFRIMESARGSIYIDDVDISQIGLRDLRSKIAIIPQDPILFAGSLRTNLDPFGIFTDTELWDALGHSHLKNFVASTQNKLQHQVSERGENLSAGQRQLVCLARALLKKPKILVLDGATAVDLETSSFIKVTIREQFASCTIFTIAHRLKTVMDSDRIAVLDGGRLVQLDTPRSLLERRSGIFYEMAKDAKIVS